MSHFSFLLSQKIIPLSHRRFVLASSKGGFGPYHPCCSFFNYFRWLVLFGSSGVAFHDCRYRHLFPSRCIAAKYISLSSRCCSAVPSNDTASAFLLQVRTLVAQTSFSCVQTNAIFPFCLLRRILCFSFAASYVIGIFLPEIYHRRVLPPGLSLLFFSSWGGPLLFPAYFLHGGSMEVFWCSNSLPERLFPLAESSLPSYDNSPWRLFMSFSSSPFLPGWAQDFVVPRPSFFSTRERFFLFS